jgi:two-component system sensor histidine kinase KdpD
MRRPNLHRSLRFAARYLLAVLVVALCSVAADIFFRITGSDRLTAIFLAGVLLTAFVAGSGPAYFASAMAFASYMFLVDPRYQWSFGSPEDFNTLAVFLVVALLVGTLTGRARDAAVSAQRRSRTSAVLLAATADFSATGEPQFVREQLAGHAAAAARGVAMVRASGAVTTVPADRFDPEVAAASLDMEQRAGQGGRGTETLGAWKLRSLVADQIVWGVLAWRTDDPRELAADELALLQVLADTGAAALARVDLAMAKAEAETRARTEDLRNALLSSISHDLRTPLAAILASASSLQEFGEDFDPATRRDLATTIQEEVLRMDDSVANLLNMTRLEAGGLQIRTVAFNLPEEVRRSIARRGRAAQDRIEVVVAPNMPEALGDPVLFEQAFGNVLENAIRHGGPEGAIEVELSAEVGSVFVSVRDHGPGVPDADLERIFEKFYRSAGAARTPGTGLGLSIARGLIQAMGGSITADHAQASDGAGAGLRIRLSAPAASALHKGGIIDGGP